MKYIYDLDNTLVFTDQANNLAYNAALKKEGLDPILLPGRITRETVLEVYPDLTDTQLARIISNKKAVYSVEQTYVNGSLLRQAKRQGKNNCFIWSSADPERASAVVDYHGLREWFSDIYFSKKTDISREIEDLSQYLSLSLQDMVVYEDTYKHIQELQRTGITVIDIMRCNLINT